MYTVLIKQKGATANDKQKSNRPVGAAVGRRFDDRLRHLAWGGRYGVGKGYPVEYGVCWHWIRKTVLFWPVSGAGFKQAQRC